VALHHVDGRQRLNDDWPRRLLYNGLCRLPVGTCPGLVAVVFRRRIVIAAAVFMVAASHPIVHISALGLGVNIAHEATLTAALRTGGFLLTASRHTGTLLRCSVVPAGRQHLRPRPVRPHHQTPDKTMTVRTTLGAGDRQKLFHSRLKVFKSCLKVFRICLQMC